MKATWQRIIGLGGAATLAAATHAATLNFDGVDDEIVVGPQAALKMTAAMTLEAWIRPARPSSAADTREVVMGREGEYLLARGGDGTIYYAKAVAGSASFPWRSTAFVVPSQVWVHLALTFDGTTVRLSANGLAVFAEAVPGAVGDVNGNLNDFRIGSRQATAQYFRGQMDEVRVWNIARSAAELQQNLRRRLQGNEAGLIAYYPFDEGAGATTLDASGHGLTGTLSGGVSGGPDWNALEDGLDRPVAGGTTVAAVSDTGAMLRGAINTRGAPATNRFEWGAGSTALEFDGVDDFVCVENGPDLANRSFSVEFWAHRARPNAYEFLFSLGSAGSSRDLLHLGFLPSVGIDFPKFSTQIKFGFFGDDLIATVVADHLDWHHWAFTYDSTTRQRRIYEDGLLVGQDIAGGNFAGAGPLRLGRYLASNAQNAFAGAMDEVRVWKDVVLDEATLRQWMGGELNNTHPNFASLEAYWKLNEGSGRAAADSSGHGFTGQFVDNPVWAPGARPVLTQTTPVAAPGSNSVLVLDGVDDYVEAPDAVWFNGGPFTVEGWVFPRSYASGSRLIDFGNGSSLENCLVAISDGISGRPALHVHKGTTVGSLAAPTPLPLNRWTHLSVTHDGVGTARIYLNGVLAAQGSMPAPGNVVRTNNYIGRSNWAADAYANAAFDDLRLWRVARTPDQIRDDSAQDVDPADPNLLLNYRFNESSGNAVVDSRAVSPQHGALVGGASRLPVADAGATLSGLAPGTVHHARLVAASTNGASVGPSERFVSLNPGRGAALAFDGVDDHVRVAGFGPQAPATEVTVEFWQRVHSVREQSSFSLEPDNIGNRLQAHVPFRDGAVYWDFGDINAGGRLSYTPPESLVGQWNHFAFVASQSGNFMRIYRNGVLEAQKSGMNTREPGGFDLILGRDTLNGAERYFDGELDEFRIWNVARPMDDIQRDLNKRLTGAEPGLVAYYRMDEGAGPALLDSGPNGLHGWLNGGTDWLPSEAPVGLPVATTRAATGAGFGSATLNGTVNPDGALPTSAWFEYGTDVAAVPGSAGNQVSFYTMASTVTSLSQINFSAPPVSVQSFANIDLGDTNGSFWAGGRTDYFAARYTGRIYLPAPGTYTFSLESDDGSQLFLDGELLVDLDGRHTAAQASGSAYLAAGHHAFEVRYFEYNLGARLKVFYAGPGIARQIIPAEAFLRHDPVYAARTAVENMPANAAAGPLTAGLANLRGNTTYHFRLVATNANGVSQGADQGFTMPHPAALTALNFDGVDDQVIVNSAAAQAGLRVTTNASWEAWINPTGPGSDATTGGIILNKEGEYEIARFPDGSIRYAVAIATVAQGRWIWINTGFVAPLSQWTHVALTYDGSMFGFYANGSLVHTNARAGGSAAIGDFNNSLNEFRIGSRQGGGQFFNGMIDEVRVWNAARTQAEIQQDLSGTLLGTEPGLLAYYRFDEGGGLVILDSGPNRYHGNLSGPALESPRYVPSGAGLWLPQVTTLPAAPVLATSAGLRGTVNPSGTNTIAYFEYGETIAYGSQTAPQVVGDGIATLPAGTTVTNLQPGTLYHFRAVARNDAGTVVGEDQTFNTLVLGCGWPISSTVNNGKAASPKHVVDAEGNAYVAGLFSGSATFKTTLQPQGGSGTNAFVGKLARGADWLWATNVPLSVSGLMSINALALDAARNLYVAGQFSGTAAFGTNLLTSAGTGSDLFVAKLNSAGNAWLWARSTGGTNQPDSANALGVSAAGSVFVAGQFRGTAAFGTNTLSSAGGSQDLFVAKLDANGNWLWARGAGGTGTNDSALALALNAAEDAFIAGRFQGTNVNVGGATLSASGGVNDTDLFVARINTAGTWLLAARGGGGGTDTATALAIDAAGQIYLLGQFAGTADYNGTVEDLNSGGGARLFVAKLNPNASMLWYAQAGTGYGDSIVVDNAGRVYISGEFSTSTELGEPVAFTLVSSGNTDVFLAQLDADAGSWNWAQKIGGSGSEGRGSIGVDGAGGVVVSGSYQNTVQIGYVLLTSPNERDIFVARLSPDPVFEHNSFVIGQPIPVPAEAQDQGRTDGGAYRQPAITILEKDYAGSDPGNSFVWSLSEHKLFAVRPVTAVFKWPLTSDPTNTTRVATCVGRSVWPASPQFHVANAPVDLEPAVSGFPLRYFSLAFTTVNGAAVDAGTKTFTAPTNGWTVLQFLNTGGALPDPSIHPSIFEIVRTVGWNEPGHLTDNEPADIGEALTRPAHHDPTGRNGYVFFERACYDGAGNDRAYDRATRTGPILPVNRDTSAADDDLVVVWYRTSPVTGIAWPDDPVRYLAQWPSDADELVLASGAGSGALDPPSFPSKRVYDQPDASLPGYNPNEEHAALYGDVLYALRNDLNARVNASEPYTLLKYRNPADNQWAMKVFRVVATNATFQFAYSAEAGQELLLPAPLGLLPLCGTSNRWVSGPGYQDHLGRLYARAAGPNNAGATLVARYWYPLQPGFFYDLDRDGRPDALPGDCVPWLDLRSGGTPGVPADVTYDIHWPTTVPALQMGETLFGAKFGLPDLRHFARAHVVFDEGDPAGTNGLASLARLFDPLAPRTVQLRPDGATNFIRGPGYSVFRAADPDSLFAGISTANDAGGLVFSDLPYVLRSRLRYDPIHKNLTFLGLLDESQRYGGADNPLLLLNVLSPRERERLKDLSANAAFAALMDALYDLSRNPNQLDLDGDEAPDKSLLVGLTLNERAEVAREELGDGPKVLTAGTAQGSGFITVVENDDPSLGGLPVKLHVIRVDGGPFRGEIKVVQSDNVFDEKLTLRHSADFGGEPQNFEFEWYYRPVEAGTDPSVFPGLLPNGDVEDLRGWIRYSAFPPGPPELNDITLGDGGTSSLLVLADNYFICRYRGYVIDGATNWSDWAGITGGGQAQLAEGWVKRVRDGLNPFEARSAAFHENETVTFASMLQQAGTRYEGDIAFDPGGGNINRLGLIEAYETVLRRARRLSIEGAPAINYQPANDALLLAAGFIADLYLLLGNEAFADAADPTIGFRTGSAGYGTLAPSIFTFQNQVDSLLEEELALLRGRDDRSATVRLPPVYNRLFWNFTRDEGEVAYAQAYNITDQNGDGFIDAADARILYPQGHGDAWGHYLTATTTYYGLLQNPNFDWVPRSEPILLSGVPVNVDYLDERKFARAAAAKARTGAEIVELTYRLNFVDDPSGQYQGYKDTDPARAWGVAEWAHRAGSGAFFDWVTANAVLPALDPNPSHTGLQKIDRTTVPELNEIVSGYESVQSQVDKADGGLNPLGLAKNVVPFDIDPSLIASGKTHFEQIYDRAIEAMKNTVTVFDHANQLSQALRALQDNVNTFSRNVDEQERDYKNRLIEIFGYPYAGDIGAGKTFPSGYDGPDIYHYMYVNAADLNGQSAPSSETLAAFFTPLFSSNVTHFFPDDLPVLVNTNLETGGILQISYPYSAEDFAFAAPAAWGQRRAPGEVQAALSELLQSQARMKQAVINYDNLLAQIDDEVELLEARFQVRATTVTIRDRTRKRNRILSTAIGISKISRGVMTAIKDSIKETSDVVLESIPKVVGTATDATAPLRGTIKLTSNTTTRSLATASGLLEIGEGVAEAVIEGNKDEAQWEIQTENYEFEVQQHLKEIEELIRKEAALRAEAFTLSEKINQTAGRYQAALAKGLRLLEERVAFRKNAAADTQASRYQDMTFRIFRNDAIQKYRAQFDLAAQYVFLAAAAYDYETQLLGGRSGAGRAFLTDIVRQRALGEVVNGAPVAGRHGLADPLARLSQNFGVLKGQLGFNNPQTETGRFSLRNELLRLRDTSDAEWRAELKKRIVRNLWDVPEFRRYCRPFAPEAAGPQPGLVLRFPTTVTFGLNYFGWPLGGGDNAYDPTLFATKVRSAGIWFSDYNGSGLSLTPRVYLVPAGADVLRSPSGNDLETREWRVVDQKIPVPFPIGFSSLNDNAWIPMNDSLSDRFADIRRFSSFRAYHDSGLFNPAETTTDSRLIGRSVWNTDWMLIIPGGTFLSDPNQGIDAFVSSVGDIKIFFQTYAYSGN